MTDVLLALGVALLIVAAGAALFILMCLLLTATLHEGEEDYTLTQAWHDTFGGTQ